MKINSVALFLVAACGASNGSVPYSPDGGSDTNSGSGSGSAHPNDELYGSVLDERNDTIDYSFNQPLHTHQGQPTDLVSGCPDVYKYAYLQNGPKYGQEAAPNPLAWHFFSDEEIVSYQVTGDASTEVVHSTQIRRTANGDYVVDLTGSAVAMHAGKLTLQVQIGDKTRIACFVNHPMAAPLKIDTPSAGEVFDWTLKASPLSHIMNSTGGGVVAKTKFTQYTGEAIPLTLTATPSAGTAKAEIVDEWLTTAPAYANVYRCADLCPAAPARTVSDPTSTTTGTMSLSVIDPSSGAVVCHATSTASYTCNIPGRGDADGPHEYDVTVTLTNERSIAPASSDASPYQDLHVGESSGWVSGLIYNTGTTTFCAHQKPFIGGGYQCDTDQTYIHVVGVNKATIDFGAIDFNFTTQIGEDTATALPTHVTLPAKTWDGGIGNL
ncbi:MAG: hypothetical protein QM831_33775 [Kofleriaceae bacterium]